MFRLNELRRYLFMHITSKQDVILKLEKLQRDPHFYNRMMNDFESYLIETLKDYKKSTKKMHQKKTGDKSKRAGRTGFSPPISPKTPSMNLQFPGFPHPPSQEKAKEKSSRSGNRGPPMYMDFKSTPIAIAPLQN